jgi:hypothetical protein
MRAGVLSWGIKRPGSKDDHSPSSSAGVENEWSHNSTPATSLQGVEREKLTTATSRAHSFTHTHARTHKLWSVPPRQPATGYHFEAHIS